MNELFIFLSYWKVAKQNLSFYITYLKIKNIQECILRLLNNIFFNFYSTSWDSLLYKEHHLVIFKVIYRPKISLYIHVWMANKSLGCLHM